MSLMPVVDEPGLLPQVGTTDLPRLMAPVVIVVDLLETDTTSLDHTILVTLAAVAVDEDTMTEIGTTETADTTTDVVNPDTTIDDTTVPLMTRDQDTNDLLVETTTDPVAVPVAQVVTGKMEAATTDDPDTRGWKSPLSMKKGVWVKRVSY